MHFSLNRDASSLVGPVGAFGVEPRPTRSPVGLEGIGGKKPESATIMADPDGVFGGESRPATPLPGLKLAHVKGFGSSKVFGEGVRVAMLFVGPDDAHEGYSPLGNVVGEALETRENLTMISNHDLGMDVDVLEGIEAGRFIPKRNGRGARAI